MELKLTFNEMLDAVEAIYDETSGTLREKIAEAFETAVRRAGFYGRKSTLRIELGFEPKDGRMLVTATVATKTPSPSALPLTAFVDHRNGSLSLEDPRQRTLDFPAAVTPEVNHAG